MYQTKARAYVEPSALKRIYMVASFACCITLMWNAIIIIIVFTVHIHLIRADVYDRHVIDCVRRQDKGSNIYVAV